MKKSPRTDYSVPDFPPYPLGPLVVKLDYDENTRRKIRNLIGNGYRMPSPDTSNR